ncbi:MAG TPA: hypothetical protein VJQ61_10155 [Sinomonas sp.]|jgi:carboxylate-amine ligase|nr:hypothetical protein [Sinomonas sp.]
MVYARLSDAHPTVEVRIADVCQDPAHAAMLPVLTRALVETAACQWQAGLAPDDVPAELLRLWMWQASRFGVEGELIDPTTRTPRPAGDALAPSHRSCGTARAPAVSASPAGGGLLLSGALG